MSPIEFDQPPTPVDGLLKIDPYMSTERKVDALIDAFKRLTMILQNLLVMRIWPVLEVIEGSSLYTYVYTNGWVLVTDNSLVAVTVE